jgi:hypothetical protein
LLMIHHFKFSRRDIANRSQQSTVVKPVNPSERCSLNIV